MAVADYIQRLLNSGVADTDRIVKVDEQTSTFAFIGVAPFNALTSEAKWKIARVYKQGTLYSIEYAAGGLFNQIWDNRTTIFPGISLLNSYSVNFDGVNDFVDFGNNYTFEVSQAFSVGFWAKPNNVAAQRCMISKCSNDANVWGYNLQHTNTGALIIQMRTPASSPTFTYTTTLVAGLWQHVVLTYAGTSNISGALVYRNSVVGNTPGSSALAGTWTNVASFVVGARNTAFPFSGNIDEVTVWNKQLTQAEINELYNSGQPGDVLSHSAVSNLLSWWRMGDDDTFPTILDHKGSINGTMTNQTSTNIQSDVP